MKKYLVLVIIMFIFSVNVFASDMSKTIGSRVLGLGGAFTAVANDANAVFINPAGLLQLKGGFMDMGYNMSNNQDFYSGHMSFANSAPQDNEAGGLGFYTKGDSVAEGKERQYIILISLAQPYGKNFYFGGNAKYIKHTSKFKEIDEIDVPSTKESAFSFDLGMFFKLHESVSFGIMGYDLGKPDISTNPRKVTVGMGLDFNHAVNIGFDIDHFAQKNARQPDYHAGIDFLPQQNMSLQVGYYTDKLNDSEAITGGFKLQLAQKDRNDYIGYAYSEELQEGLDKKTEKLHSISVGLFY